MSDILDGAAGPRQEARVRRHLTECEACRKFQEGLSRMNGALKSAHESRLSQPAREGYWGSFWDRLQPQLADPRPSAALHQGRALRLIAVAAYVAAAAFVAVLMVQEHGRAARLQAQLGRALGQISRLEGALDRKEAANVQLAGDRGLAAIDKLLFHEVDLTFDRDVQWVATNDVKVDLGVSHTGLPEVKSAVATTPDSVAGAQVGVFEETDGGLRLLNRARILARDGAKADFTSEAGGLTYRYAYSPMIGSSGEATIRLNVGAFEAAGDASGMVNACLKLRDGDEAEAGRFVLKDKAFVVRVALTVWRPAREPQ